MACTVYSAEVALHAVILAAPPVEPRPPGEALRSLVSLWAILALLGVILVVTVAVLVAGRRRKRLRAAARRRSGPALKDAWMEAGRRIRPEDFQESPPPPEPRGPEERYS